MSKKYHDENTTLICAATLSSVCAYAADIVTTIEPSAFVDGTATLSENLAQNATTWSIETTFTYKKDTEIGYWGTTILSTASGVTENSYQGGFQLWVGTKGNLEGNLIAKGCGFDNGTSGTALGSTLTADSRYTVVLDVVYNETAKNDTTSLTLKGSVEGQIGTATSTYTFQEGDVISHLYTACGKNEGATTWIAPKVTLTTSGVLVPEPATATLSLLALAGLAARRRRH